MCGGPDVRCGFGDAGRRGRLPAEDASGARLFLCGLASCRIGHRRRWHRQRVGHYDGGVWLDGAVELELVTLTSGTSGTGSGQVTFSAAQNANTAPRSGSLAVAEQTVTVTQDGQPVVPVCILTASSQNKLNTQRVAAMGRSP